MIHGDTKTPESRPDADEANEPGPKLPAMGKLKTDEEVRLAREIEKLLGQGSAKEDGGDA
jgi:hypothetical protein